MTFNDSVCLATAAMTGFSTVSVFTVAISALRARVTTSSSPFSLVVKLLILPGNTLIVSRMSVHLSFWSGILLIDAFCRAA